MKSDVIPAQRRKLILGLIRQKGVLSVHELANVVGVSQPTIRRDLDLLAREGNLERSHGGAAVKEYPGTTHEPDYRVTAHLAREEKAAIGRLVVDQLRANQSVIFDSSTTVYEAAKLAVERRLHLTAVTNDIRICELFSGTTDSRLIVCGGSIRPGSFTLVGEPGTSFLQQLKVDVAIMGIHALSGAICYDTSLEVSYIKRYMVAAAKKVFVLADSSKFGEVAFFEAFELDNRTEVITDRPPPPSVEKAILQKGAKIRCSGTLKKCAEPAHGKDRTLQKEKLN